MWKGLFGIGLLSGAACSTVIYQPVAGLQDPVLADLQRGNLEGSRIMLRCLDADASAAQQLCRRMVALLTNQGAQVQSEQEATGVVDNTTNNNSAQQAPDLYVDIHSQQTDEEHSRAWAVFSYATLSLLPITREAVFDVDMTVRDGQGFLLGNRHLGGRLIEHFSIVFVFFNWLFNHVTRGPGEQQGTTATGDDLSRDLYEQVCQTVVSARLRERAFVQATGQGS